MGLYDRDYMRADQPRLRPLPAPRTASPSRTSHGTAGSDHLEPSDAILGALLALQGLAFVLPIAHFAPFARRLTWLEEFGVTGFEVSARHLLLVAPGLLLVAGLVGAIGRGRVAALLLIGIAAVGLNLVVGATGDPLAIADGLSLGHLVPAGTASVLLAATMSSALIATVADRNLVLRAPFLLLTAAGSALYVASPFWNPLDMIDAFEHVRALAMDVRLTPDHTLAVGGEGTGPRFLLDRSWFSYLQWLGRAGVVFLAGFWFLVQACVAVWAILRLSARTRLEADMPPVGVVVAAFVIFNLMSLVCFGLWAFAAPFGGGEDAFWAVASRIGVIAGALAVLLLPSVGVGRLLVPARPLK